MSVPERFLRGGKPFTDIASFCQSFSLPYKHWCLVAFIPRQWSHEQLHNRVTCPVFCFVLGTNSFVPEATVPTRAAHTVGTEYSVCSAPHCVEPEWHLLCVLFEQDIRQSIGRGGVVETWKKVLTGIPAGLRPQRLWIAGMKDGRTHEYLQLFSLSEWTSLCQRMSGVLTRECSLVAVSMYWVQDAKVYSLSSLESYSHDGTLFDDGVGRKDTDRWKSWIALVRDVYDWTVHRCGCALFDDASIPSQEHNAPLLELLPQLNPQLWQKRFCGSETQKQMQRDSSPARSPNGVPSFGVRDETVDALEGVAKLNAMRRIARSAWRRQTGEYATFMLPAAASLLAHVKINDATTMQVDDTDNDSRAISRDRARTSAKVEEATKQVDYRYVFMLQRYAAAKRAVDMDNRDCGPLSPQAVGAEFHLLPDYGDVCFLVDQVSHPASTEFILDDALHAEGEVLVQLAPVEGVPFDDIDRMLRWLAKRYEHTTTDAGANAARRCPSLERILLPANEAEAGGDGNGHSGPAHRRQGEPNWRRATADAVSGHTRSSSPCPPSPTTAPAEAAAADEEEEEDTAEPASHRRTHARLSRAIWECVGGVKACEESCSALVFPRVVLRVPCGGGQTAKPNPLARTRCAVRAYAPTPAMMAAAAAALRFVSAQVVALGASGQPCRDGPGEAPSGCYGLLFEMTEHATEHAADTATAACALPMAVVSPSLWHRRCGWCGRPRQRLRRCAGCQAVLYCSPAHQAMDWTEGCHRTECAHWRRARELYEAHLRPRWECPVPSSSPSATWRHAMHRPTAHDVTAGDEGSRWAVDPVRASWAPPGLSSATAGWDVGASYAQCALDWVQTIQENNRAGAAHGAMYRPTAPPGEAVIYVDVLGVEQRYVTRMMQCMASHVTRWAAAAAVGPCVCSDDARRDGNGGIDGLAAPSPRQLRLLLCSETFAAAQHNTVWGIRRDGVLHVRPGTGQVGDVWHTQNTAACPDGVPCAFRHHHHHNNNQTNGTNKTNTNHDDDKDSCSNRSNKSRDDSSHDANDDFTDTVNHTRESENATCTCREDRDNNSTSGTAATTVSEADIVLIRLCSVKYYIYASNREGGSDRDRCKSPVSPVVLSFGPMSGTGLNFLNASLETLVSGGKVGVVWTRWVESSFVGATRTQRTLSARLSQSESTCAQRVRHRLLGRAGVGPAAAAAAATASTRPELSLGLRVDGIRFNETAVAQLWQRKSGSTEYGTGEMDEDEGVNRVEHDGTGVEKSVDGTGTAAQPVMPYTWPNSYYFDIPPVL